ncbi:MAG: GGDEF domain-containing protein [Gammaproteobacteria bacterium]|nr:GGDEF domain-containing protein [Gammaproteobacteria bacterium]
MENQNLAIALALVSMITGVALLVNWAGNKQIPGLLRIAAGYMTTCVGILLLSLEGTQPPFISIFLANALIMGGRIPVLSGLANFWNQETTKLPLIFFICFLGTMAGIYYFIYIDESILWRIRISAVMMVIFSTSTAYVLAKGLKIERKLRPVMAINTNFGAYLLLTLSLFNAVVEFVLMLFLDTQPLSSAEPVTTVLLIGAIVSMTIFAFSIIIMTMEELKVEYQEDAIFDPITTILNERTFIEVSNRVLGVALRYSKPVSMLTLELTNLDDIIKQHGIKVGNAMLRHFALMATDRRRNEDVLARSSYKQFRMLLPGVDEAGSKIVIKKIENAVLGEEYVYRGNSLRAEFLISAITKREEDLHLQQMLQEGEVEIIRLKHPPVSPA